MFRRGIKRRLAVLLAAAALALSACSAAVPSEYVQVRAHSETAEKPRSDALTAENYAQLKSVIRSFVEGSVEHGIIRVYSYDGDVEQDLADAARAVWRDDPLGAYAVDYLTYSCSLIVSYYELRVDITYRRTPAQLARLEYLSSSMGGDLKKRLERAAERYEDTLAIYFSYYTPCDFEQLVRACYDAKPGTIMSMPDMTVTFYPDSGAARIVELTFAYPADAAAMRQMEKAVSETVSAAAVYTRYCNTETDRAQLFYTFLTERFPYTQQDSRTPVYSLLCEGTATSEGAAKCWQMLCDETDIPCRTVQGLRSGESYWWNVVQLDGRWYHIDLLRDLMDGVGVRTYSDAAMDDYYWDASAYPACPEYDEPEEEQQPDGDQPAPEDPEPPDGEQPADEPTPDTEQPAPDTSEAEQTSRVLTPDIITPR